ncbi:MAG TPA: AI-2E family transporter [Candidatus Omnitrophota bacterium]|nr:AI-2E family transporter [Candidatus Omnitrophota bacterium]
MDNNIDKERRFQTVCLLILSIIAIAFALYWLKPMMIPFVLALFFSLILTSLIDFQIKYFKVPRFLALTTTLIIGILILITLGLLISVSVTQMLVNFDSYQEKVFQLLNKAALSLNVERFGMNPQEILDPLKNNLTKSVGGMVIGIVNSIVKLLSQGLLVLIFVCFLLLGKTIQTKPPGKEWKEGVYRVKRFIATKMAVSIVTGVLVGAALMILGVDMALAFGLFAFILNFIPSIGSTIATLLPLPVVLINPDITPLTGFLAIAIPGVIQFVISNFVEPKVEGDALELHPVAVLMALIFWGMIWGIVGMFLASPLTAIMKIIFQRIEFTVPLAHLLAGRVDDIQS